MTYSPFVGRARELELLGTLLSEATKAKPATVMLGGESGVGKSRLLVEFAAVARDEGAHVLRGACIELGTGDLPYAPLIEALRLFVREHGEARVRELAGPAWDELAGMISDFTGIAPTGPSAGSPGPQLHVFGAILRLLDHLGADAPILLIFEDLHWTDPSTLDLVSYLTRAMTTERVLVVGTHRDDLVPGHPLRTLLAEPEFTRRTRLVDLARFTWPEMRRFLSVAGPVDHELVQRYYALSEGNAFFAEQLMAAGSISLTSTGRMPELLNELMLTRIRRLGRDAAALMRVAATAGRRVSDRLLAAVSKLAEDDRDAALRECLEAGMLVADPADPADATYTFRHALLRETVYRGLLAGERTRTHAAMAEAITADPTLSVERELSVAVELAYHWFSAGRQAEALTAAVRAGAATIRMRAFQEAETHYRQAQRLWSEVSGPEGLTGVTHERILILAADAARWAGHVAAAVEFILEAIGEVDPLENPRLAGELYERLGGYQWEAGEYDRSAEAYDEAARLLANQPPDPVRIRVLTGQAMVKLLAGRYDDGLDLAEQAIAMADGVGTAPDKSRPLNTAGLALTMRGQAARGVKMLRDARRIAEQTDHLEDMLRAYGNLGVALEIAGDLPRSVEMSLEGLALAHRYGLANTRQGGLFANNASAALFLLGRWDEAEALLGDALLDHPPVRQSAYLRLTLAEIDVARGRFDDADARLREVREVSTVDPRFIEPLHTIEAELALWRDDPDAAAEMVALAVDTVRAPENVLVDLRLCAVGLRAAADRKATGDADELLARVHRVVGDQPKSAEVEALVGQCTAEHHRVHGHDTAVTWDDTAAAWENLERPYPAAYARWREAAAATAAGDAVRAAEAAGAAGVAATRLNAAPLRAAVGPMAAEAAHDVAADDGRGAARRDTGSDAHALTRREREVFELLVDGLTYRQMGSALYISEKTVSVHVHNILTKLKVGSRNEATAMAHRTNLFGVPAAGRPAPSDHR